MQGCPESPIGPRLVSVDDSSIEVSLTETSGPASFVVLPEELLDELHAAKATRPAATSAHCVIRTYRGDPRREHLLLDSLIPGILLTSAPPVRSCLRGP